MTAEALSLNAQLARDTVGRWIRGTTVPTLAALRKAENVLSGQLGYVVDLSAAVSERRTARRRDRAVERPGSADPGQSALGEVLRFLARTRLFVLEMRRRLAELEDWSARLSTDAREVEDLEARAQILRHRFLKELPDMQTSVGMWAPANVIAIFDEIYDFGPKVASALSVALHFKVDGKRFRGGIDMTLGELDHLATLLNQARDLVLTELQPSRSEAATPRQDPLEICDIPH
jgi:hypothetical protein